MEFLDNQLADYRLAPPAMLTLTASSERARNASGISFDELPGNLRRVLGSWVSVIPRLYVQRPV